MISYKTELCHHGIKGQKWGVRRYRNKDGSLTEAGKKRYAQEPQEKKSLSKTRFKKIMLVTGAATLAAAATYAAVNPGVRKMVSSYISNPVAGRLAGTSERIRNYANKGKEYLKKTVAAGAKEGIEEGLKNGSKKLVNSIIVGSTMMIGKKALDKVIGTDNSGKIMKANDKKKIGSFWNYKEPKKDEDEDDD